MTEQALGRIMDADFAKESTAFVEIPDPESGSNINASASGPVKSLLLQLINNSRKVGAGSLAPTTLTQK